MLFMVLYCCPIITQCLIWFVWTTLLQIWLTKTTPADQLTSLASNLMLIKIFLVLFDFELPHCGGEQHGSRSCGKLYSIHCCHGNICRSWAFSSQNVRILVRNSFTSWFFWASNSCKPEKSSLKCKKTKCCTVRGALYYQYTIKQKL